MKDFSKYEKMMGGFSHDEVLSSSHPQNEELTEESSSVSVYIFIVQAKHTNQ